MMMFTQKFRTQFCLQGDVACSFQTVSSQPDELVSNTQVGLGEISSTCSGNTSTEDSLSEEDHLKNESIDTSGAVSTKPFCARVQNMLVPRYQENNLQIQQTEGGL